MVINATILDMKSSPMVTVIMPVYNAAEFVKKAIVSILNQNFKDWELLIVDDGSTDDTLIQCKVAIRDDKRIKIIQKKTHSGITNTLNIGIKMARGRYIARQDADDESMPKRLFYQVKFLENNQDYGLVSSLFIVQTKQGKIIKIPGLPLDDYEIKLSLKFFNPFTHGAVMMRKKILEENQLFYDKKDKHCEDYGLWIRLSKYTKFKIISKPLYIWTFSKTGITASNLLLMANQRKKIAKKYKPVVKLKKLINLRNKYKNIKWEYEEINFCQTYQKLLLRSSFLLLKNYRPLFFLILFFYSFVVNPKTYFFKILNSFQLLSKKENLENLDMERLINKI